MTIQQAPRKEADRATSSPTKRVPAWLRDELAEVAAALPLYTDLILDRIEERGKRVDCGVNARARQLAETFGAQDRTPRDVVDLHTDAVRRLTHAADPRRAAGILASAQLVLVEVLGHLAGHYRRRATGVTS